MGAILLSLKLSFTAWFMCCYNLTICSTCLFWNKHISGSVIVPIFMWILIQGKTYPNTWVGTEKKNSPKKRNTEVPCSCTQEPVSGLWLHIKTLFPGVKANISTTQPLWRWWAWFGCDCYFSYSDSCECAFGDMSETMGKDPKMMQRFALAYVL